MEAEKAENCAAPMRLYSTVIHLRALANGRLSISAGQLAHGAFLEIVRQVDPDLSTRLHNGNGVRPYTLSSLHTSRRSDGGVVEGDACWLRLTALDATVFDTFMGTLVRPSQPLNIRLGNIQFAVTEAVTTSGNHKWSGYTDWSSLADADLAAEICLEFVSPTSFSFGNRNMVLPLPDLIFGSYLSKWNAFGPSIISKDLVGKIREQVVVSRYRLETDILEFDRYRQIGFMGTCWFQAKGAWSEDELRKLNALANFAFYAGTGYKTTMGMGQTRRVDIG